MRTLLAVAVFAALGVGHAGPGGVRTARTPGPGPGLTAEDRAYLEALLSDFLFDPKEAVRVRVTVSVRRLRMWNPTPETTEERDGWLVGGDGRRPSRVYFIDGAAIPAAAAERITPISFRTACRLRYSTDPVLAYPRSVSGYLENADLAVAAWLHRLGHDDLAARALAVSRAACPDPREELRRSLAYRAGTDLVESFCLGNDLAALGHGARLFRHYSDHATRDVDHAADIMTDLVRRWWGGSLGCVAPYDWPQRFLLWNPTRKLDCLIDSLDQVAEDSSPPSRQQRTEKQHVESLAALGEMAIPALLDTMEFDRRLTRVPQRDRGDLTGRVITVREQAHAAVRAILGVYYSDPTGQGDPDPGWPAEVSRLRLYWQVYGRLPFHERMMRILTDPQATNDARREAAANLTRPRNHVRWDRERTESPRWPAQAVISRFQRPTVAEAILALIDQTRPAVDDPEATNPDARWLRDEESLLDCLVQLGDVRIAAELSRRARAIADPIRRRRHAIAAHRLGVSAAWIDLLREVETGTLPLAVKIDGTVERLQAELVLVDLSCAMVDNRVPEADRAVQALTRFGHAYEQLVAQNMIEQRALHSVHGMWEWHPACLDVLRRGLDDHRSTGLHYYRRGDKIEAADRNIRRSPLPENRRNPDDWREHAEERVSDLAAGRVAAMIIGVPEYHPLHRDAERSRQAMKTFLTRHQFRRLTFTEMTRFRLPALEPVYMPDIPPLGRAATPADVAAGRAVFHLHGRGTPIAWNRPAWVVLKGGEPSRPTRGTIVQIESGPDGSRVYGVIFRNAIRAVCEDEVRRIEPASAVEAKP